MIVNDIIKMECIDLNHDGLGVCKVEGFPVFVEDMLIGEIAHVEILQVTKSYARGMIKEMRRSSPNRVKPRCKKFGLCGGCQLLHLNYQQQLVFKKKMVEETIKRIGHTEVVVEKIYGMDNPYYYRNKVQIPFGMKKDKVICGFYQKKSHTIIPLEECFIEPVLATDIVRFIKNLANELKISAYDESSQVGNLKHVLIRKNSSEEYMVVLITKENKINNVELLVEKITNRYPSVKSIIQNINQNENNVILGDKHKVFFGSEVLIEELGGLKFEMSHQSFFQTNHQQTEILYQLVLDSLDPKSDQVIIDAYCGVGTISLMLAKKCAKVYGIEIVEEAIENAKKNCKLNNIDNAEFIVGASEEVIRSLVDKKIDAIVVDPPRKGCARELLETVIESEIPVIVYVSCDVATLARDINILSEKYQVKKVNVVDMFPHTHEVETVALLSFYKAK